MKVGVFIDDYEPEVGGGYTIQSDIFFALIKLANECKHNFVIFTYGKSRSNIDKLLESSKISVIYYKPPNILERLMSEIGLHLPLISIILKRPGKLDRLSRAAGIDIMWFISPASVQVDVPYITIVWDLQHRLQPWFPEVSSNGIWQDRELYHLKSLRRATFIVAGTETGRDEIKYFYNIPSEHIRILPHPTPTYALNADQEVGKAVLTKYAIPEGYLFYPAQFWSHKNHANLLISVKILKNKYGLKLPVVLVGSDKGNLNYIKQLATELDLSTQIHFLGFVPQEDLTPLYRNAFALVYLTFFGPENLPPLEAFALGCPVVASNVPGASEQLGDAALLVDPKSPEQIALTIKTLHDSPELQNTLIKKGHEKASKWTAEDFVRGIFSILDEYESVRRCWETISRE